MTTEILNILNILNGLAFVSICFACRRLSKQISSIRTKMKRLEKNVARQDRIIDKIADIVDDKPSDPGPLMKMAGAMLIPLADSIEDPKQKEVLQSMLDPMFPNPERKMKKMIDHFLSLNSELYPTLVKYLGTLAKEHEREDVRRFFEQTEQEAAKAEKFEHAAQTRQFIKDFKL